MHRRAAIGLLLAVTLATSGCSQAVSGGPITFEASPASVSDAALQETGYRAQQREQYQVNRTVDLPAVGEREVRIGNHVATYSRIEAGNGTGEQSAAGGFVVLSTPQAKVAGQGTNPLGTMPLKQLVEQVANRAGGDQSEIRHVGTEGITVLGTDTKAEKFSTKTSVDGETVETYVYVVRVGHGDDYVVGVGVLPKQFEGDEGAIYRLMRGLQHAGG